MMAARAQIEVKDSDGAFHLIDAESFDGVGNVIQFYSGDNQTGHVVAVFFSPIYVKLRSVAKLTPDELQAAEQRGYDRARPLHPDRVYVGVDVGRGDVPGTLGGATVTATDADLEPGDGPIPPAAPLSAYEGGTAVAAPPPWVGHDSGLPGD